MDKIDEYIKNVIAPSVASECAEWDAVEARKIQEQIKNRPGRYESIEGFYVEGDGCEPMLLNSGEQPTATLCRPYLRMTIFKYEKRAQQAIKQTEMHIKKYDHISIDMKIVSTGKGDNIYHFLDDDSRVWLPNSSLMEICDEQPEPFYAGLKRGDFLKSLPLVRSFIRSLERYQKDGVWITNWHRW